MLLLKHLAFYVDLRMVYKTEYIAKLFSTICKQRRSIHHSYIGNFHFNLVNFMQQRPPNNGFHFKLRCPFQFSVNSLNINYTEHCNCWHLMLLSISFYHKRMEIYAVQLTQLSECKRKSMIFYNGFIVIFTARKRSFGQGNIFTSVCHSFC